MRRRTNLALIWCVITRDYDVSIAVETVVGLVGHANKAVGVLTTNSKVALARLPSGIGLSGYCVGQFIVAAGHLQALRWHKSNL